MAHDLMRNPVNSKEKKLTEIETFLNATYKCIPMGDTVDWRHLKYLVKVLVAEVCESNYSSDCACE